MTRRNKLTIKEFSISDVALYQQIGESHFGKVYQGEWINYVKSSHIPVAINMLNSNSDWKSKTEFLSEMEKLSKLKHVNVLSLLGMTSSSQQPVCLLFEYSTCEDLHKHLMMHSSLINENQVSSSDILQTNELSLINICIQISQAMEYLISKHYVHGDLATRNIYVENCGILKITILRIKRTEYADDYIYTGTNSPGIPIRWMPAEAIVFERFTTESDIWSFGILLWEVYSYGLQPYYRISDADVVDMIHAHQILHCPVACPAKIYSLMIKCWHELPSDRPSFQYIHRYLCNLLVDSGTSILDTSIPLSPHTFRHIYYASSSTSSQNNHNGTTSSSATPTTALPISIQCDDLYVSYQPLLNTLELDKNPDQWSTGPWVQAANGCIHSAIIPVLPNEPKLLKSVHSNSNNQYTTSIPQIISPLTSPQSSPKSSCSNSNIHLQGERKNNYQAERLTHLPVRPSYHVVNYIRTSLTDKHVQASQLGSRDNTCTRIARL